MGRNCLVLYNRIIYVKKLFQLLVKITKMWYNIIVTYWCRSLLPAVFFISKEVFMKKKNRKKVNYRLWLVIGGPIFLSACSGACGCWFFLGKLTSEFVLCQLFLNADAKIFLCSIVAIVAAIATYGIQYLFFKKVLS